ncbi:halocyanin domain-containing protein [Halobaculum sp. CBA1158]|uniref:halocyanin domain-containing protein n=1 Tax=Halobaculum sp. CBA1158 TaxID=2904243 RepID=UPI001F477AB5|nr:halocyanin domain-containing protein [Halobaculum sp. CBA1158]UIO99174.1 halocyanin domain-containing protein [Halobaculum sp. CBA1158]
MSDPTESPADAGGATTRRRVTTAVAAATVAALAGCSGGGGGGAGGDDTDADGDGESEPYDGWLSDARGFDGSVADERGAEEVTVVVGAGGSGYAFDPPAVRVSPDTTVVWEWTGMGNRHNVVADGGDFESDYYASEGATFSRKFTDSGVTRYYCTPHQNLGMKGVIEVAEG